MAGIQRSAKRTARFAGKTVQQAKKTAGRMSDTASKGVVGAIGRARSAGKKSKVALAIGLTAAAIALNKMRKGRKAVRAAKKA